MHGSHWPACCGQRPPWDRGPSRRGFGRSPRIVSEIGGTSFPPVPSRLNTSSPRMRTPISTTTSAPTERIAACSSGGKSGNASFTETWLKPHDRHSSSMIATAAAESGREVGVLRVSVTEAMGPVLVSWRERAGLSRHARARPAHPSLFRKMDRRVKPGADTR